MTFEADNIEQLEICVKNYMKKAQYRKYKEKKLFFVIFYFYKIKYLRYFILQRNLLSQY